MVQSDRFPTTLTKESKPFLHQESFLPAATAQCHASNLLLLKNGDLLCAWFGGSQEGKSDISIYVSRLTAGSDTWAEPNKVSDDPSRSEQNPVLFETPAGDVWLLHTAQDAGNQDSAVVKRRISIDGAKSWAPSEIFISDRGTFIRQPIVVTADGTWLLPVFKCRTEPGKRWVGNDDISCVRYSSDQGQTWAEKAVPGSEGCVHMEIQRLKNDTYIALYRSRWADHIYSSVSKDGIDWSEPQPTDLPNPNSGICFDILQSGRLVAIYNHSSKLDAKARREGLYDDIAIAGDDRQNQSSKHAGKEAFWGAPRAPLCIGWSDDKGQTWNHRIIEDGDGYCLTNNSEQKKNRELSYPSMVLGEDGSIHIAFTYWRQTIKYVRAYQKDIFD